LDFKLSRTFGIAFGLVYCTGTFGCQFRVFYFLNTFIADLDQPSLERLGSW